MRLHVVGMPHTQTTDAFLTCAYTQKVVKFAEMMHRPDEGVEVVLYAGDHRTMAPYEHVALFTEAEREAVYGPWDPNTPPNVDWDPKHPGWREMNARAVQEIRKRMEPRDFLCLVAGWSQSPIAVALPELLPVEWAVGYYGITMNFRIFESYAWMHHVYGAKGIQDGAAYDCVIPNFFDPRDFRAGDSMEHGTEDLLFIGRLVARKGPHVAAEIAKRAGRRLLVAGPGATSWKPGRIDCPEIVIEGPGVEYVGPVGKDERAQLMKSAAAVIVPTQYIEPFGGVAVEAMFCGTPVITTDWGAFTETVPLNVGRRFRTLREGVRAVDEVADLDRAQIEHHAYWNYSLNAVHPRFREHFERLETLWGDGWYAE